MLLKLFVSCLLMALPVDVVGRLVGGFSLVDVVERLVGGLPLVDVLEGLADELSSVDVAEDGLSERR